MLKVIVVDDEALIRIGIKSCIEWEQHGFEFVGQAEDGESAVALIENVCPNIVITDIRMPKMDGLKLLEYLKKNHPKIRTIVLSCYNELDYVKTAMKLGAEDYILKLSMEPEHLLGILENVKKLIHCEADASENKAEAYTPKEKMIIREEFYKQFLSGGVSTKYHLDKMRDLGCPVGLKHYVALCCEIDNYSNALSRLGDPNLFKASVLNILEESLLLFENSDEFEADRGKYVIILGFLEPVSIENKIIRLCGKLNELFKLYFNFSVSFAVSSSFNDFDLLPVKYMEMQNILLHKFYRGSESVIFSGGIADFCREEPSFPPEKEKELREAFVLNDSAGVQQIITGFFRDLQARAEYPPQKVRLCAAAIFMAIARFSRENGLHSEYFLADNGGSAFQILSDAETLNEIISRLCQQVAIMIEDIKKLQYGSHRREIITIKQYISRHIDEAISLEKASQICNINKCYFSSIFKRETGQSFTDYLNRVKMQKAGELIREKGLKAYEAAYQVGIPDESYFSKLFKKYMGVNPSSLK